MAERLGDVGEIFDKAVIKPCMTKETPHLLSHW